MTTKVASVLIDAKWRGDREVRKANAALKSLHDGEVSRGRQSHQMFVDRVRDLSNMERAARKVDVAMRAFRRGMNPAGFRALSSAIGDIGREAAKSAGQLAKLTSAAAGRQMMIAGRSAARSFGRGLVSELKGVGRLIPGVKSIGGGGPFLGSMLGKAFPGPKDALDLPMNIGAQVLPYARGMAILMVPAAVHQSWNALGVAISAVPPALLGAFAAMNAGLSSFAKTSGIAIDRLHELKAIGRVGNAFAGQEFAEAAIGLDKRLAEAALDSEGGGAKTIATMKTAFGAGGTSSIFDQITRAKDPVERMRIAMQAIQDLRNGVAQRKGADGKLTPIGTDEQADLARQIALLAGGDDSLAAAMMKVADAASRSGQSVGQYFDEIGQTVGNFTPEMETNIDRISVAFGRMLNAFTGVGTRFFGARGGVFAGWAEDLAKFLEVTTDARALKLAGLFDVNKGGIGSVFDWLAGRGSAFDQVEMPNGEKFFRAADGSLSKIDPRIQPLKEFGEALKDLAARAKDFMVVIAGIGSLFTSGGILGPGGWFDRLGERQSGGIGGFFKGMSSAFNMPDGTAFTDRMRRVISSTMTGAGFDNVVDANAFERLGEEWAGLWEGILDRVADVISDHGGITRALADLGRGVLDRMMMGEKLEGRGGGDRFQQIGRSWIQSLEVIIKSATAMAADGIGQILDALSGDSSAATLVGKMKSAGLAIGSAIVEGIAQGIASSVPGLASLLGIGQTKSQGSNDWIRRNLLGLPNISDRDRDFRSLNHRKDVFGTGSVRSPLEQLSDAASSAASGLASMFGGKSKAIAGAPNRAAVFAKGGASVPAVGTPFTTRGGGADMGSVVAAGVSTLRGTAAAEARGLAGAAAPAVAPIGALAGASQSAAAAASSLAAALGSAAAAAANFRMPSPGGMGGGGGGMTARPARGTQSPSGGDRR